MRSNNSEFHGLMSRAFTVLLALMLAGCGGGGGNNPADDDNDNDQPPMEPNTYMLISGGGTTVNAQVSQPCPGCTVSNANNAIDDSFDSFAELVIPQGIAGSATVQVNAQAGIVFPAGSDGGVQFSLPNGVTSGSLSLSFLVGNDVVHTSGVILSGIEDYEIREPQFFAVENVPVQFDGMELSILKNNNAGVSVNTGHGDMQLRAHAFAVR